VDSPLVSYSSAPSRFGRRPWSAEHRQSSCACRLESELTSRFESTPRCFSSPSEAVEGRVQRIDGVAFGDVGKVDDGDVGSWTRMASVELAAVSGMTSLRPWRAGGARDHVERGGAGARSPCREVQNDLVVGVAVNGVMMPLTRRWSRDDLTTGARQLVVQLRWR